MSWCWCVIKGLLLGMGLVWLAPYLVAPLIVVLCLVLWPLSLALEAGAAILAVFGLQLPPFP